MCRFWFITLLLFASFALPAGAADLPPLQVRGNSLVAAGKPIHLRGIDWGWWETDGTRYTENDMRRQARWGANVARLAFSFRDLETPGQPGRWNEQGFQQMDDVVNWGAKYGVYVILDMHETPGGQNAALYDDGGGNKLWTDPTDQADFIALWKKIAQRYRNQPAVAAYELMNEPATGLAPADSLPKLCRQTTEAIRAIDPQKIIVLMGNNQSGPAELTDAIYQPLPNILYTMHFYNGASQSWLHNLNNGPGLSGTKDWTLITHRFTAPDTATRMNIMLRSSANSGTAWFDDVRLEDGDGKLLESGDFHDGADGYAAQRGPRAPMKYDPSVGHDSPGSLSVHGTVDYNGWSSPLIDIEPGKTYVLSAWVKLADATGDTYLTAAFFSDLVRPKDQLRTMMQPSIDFSKKHNVPVWVGEFGCEASALDGGQEKWVSDCISLFDEAGFEWTYWNYRETTDPMSMALQPEHKDASDYPINMPLLDVLQAGWKKNKD